MAGTTSISGLVSGLDTATIISQLMQVESQPQTLMKGRLTTEQSTVSNLQSLNAKFAALTTRAHDLANAAAWGPLKTSSTSDKISSVAGSVALPGSLGLTVQQTATAHQVTFANTAAASATVTTGSTHVTLTKHDGSTVDIDTGDGTLNGLVKAVNAANAGATASTVKLDDGSYRLRVVATATGAGSDFTLTNTDGSALLGGTTVVAGQDAAITVGSDTIHSSTNTFTSLAPGLDVTIAPGTPAGTTADLTVSRDGTTASNNLKSLVDAANDILSQIDTLTAYDATTKKSGALAGDSSVRELRSRVIETVTSAADGSSLASLGVQTDRSGKITFDATTFATAFAADPASVAAKLGAPSTGTVPGFASRLEAVGKLASDSVSGTLTTDIQGHQSTAKTLQDGIDAWDVRLAAKQNALNLQFSNLEVTLGKLQDQASWLSGQISSLPSASSS